jgi:hypothetical protein
MDSTDDSLASLRQFLEESDNTVGGLRAMKFPELVLPKVEAAETIQVSSAANSSISVIGIY